MAQRRRQCAHHGARGDRRRDRCALFGRSGLAAHRRAYPGELSLGLARRVAWREPWRSSRTCWCSTNLRVARCGVGAASCAKKSRGWSTKTCDDADRHPRLREAIDLADRVFLLSPAPRPWIATLDIANAARANDPRDCRGARTAGAASAGRRREDLSFSGSGKTLNAAAPTPREAGDCREGVLRFAKILGCGS